MMGSGIVSKDLDALRDLGLVSQLRGLDGTGVFQTKSIRKQNNYTNHNHVNNWGDYDYERMHKTRQTFSSFHLENKYHTDWYRRSIMDTTIADVFMCHVRSATRGSINDSNAHPFKFNNLVGAHNGTLRDKEYQDNFKTDSELMFGDMNERGIVPVLEALDRESAFAVSIYNYEDKSMYFARNDLRPLAIAFCEERAVMYWASEIEMLRFVLDRCGILYKPYTVFPDLLVKIKAEDITVSGIRDNPLKILTVVKKLDRLKPVLVQQAIDRMAERRAKEAEQKQKAETESSSEEKVTEVEVKETEVKKILPFRSKGKRKTVPSTPKFKTKEFLRTCSCGCFELDLVQQSRISRGQNINFRYNADDDEFYCKNEGCGTEAKEA